MHRGRRRLARDGLTQRRPTRCPAAVPLDGEGHRRGLGETVGDGRAHGDPGDAAAARGGRERRGAQGDGALEGRLDAIHHRRPDVGRLAVRRLGLVPGPRIDVRRPPVGIRRAGDRPARWSGRTYRPRRRQVRRPPPRFHVQMPSPGPGGRARRPRRSPPTRARLRREQGRVVELAARGPGELAAAAGRRGPVARRRADRPVVADVELLLAGQNGRRGVRRAAFRPSTARGRSARPARAEPVDVAPSPRSKVERARSWPAVSSRVGAHPGGIGARTRESRRSPPGPWTRRSAVAEAELSPRASRADRHAQLAVAEVPVQ